MTPDLMRQVETFLKRDCYGTQYGDHDRICSVCPLIALILARERAVWEEAAKSLEARSTCPENCACPDRKLAIEFRRRNRAAPGGER